MTRTDMIILMMDEIIHIEDMDGCERLLAKMEKAGMLPPPNQNIYDLVPTVTPTGNFDYSFKREWESENE